jgi:tetrahydromethanopterin S-methyltransferase subunit G
MAKWSSLGALAVLILFGALAALAPNRSSVDSICRIIDASARAHALPVEFLSRLIWQESSFRPDAVSPAGARGVAQFMPATAAERGLANPDDPEAAIPKAAELLASFRQRFGNLGLAAAAYNAGATRVAGWLQGAGDLAPETQNYVTILTRHSVEDWRGTNAATLTDRAIFTEASCAQTIAALRRAEPAILSNSAAGTPAIVQVPSGSWKGPAMLNTYVAYLASAPIQKIYDAYFSPPLVFGVFACAALIYFLAYVRKPIDTIRDELRRNNNRLEAILRGGASSTGPLIPSPVPAVDRGLLLNAKQAERLFDSPEPAVWPGLGSLSAPSPLDPPGVRAPTPEAEESAPSASAPATTRAGLTAGFDSDPPKPPLLSRPEVSPVVDPAFRRPPPQARKAKSPALKVAFAGAVLALFAAGGALAVLGPPQDWPSAKGPLASAVGVLDAPLEAITHSTEREEERSAIRDLGASLAQITARLDRIERDYGARLDKLNDTLNKDSSAGSADIATRLDKLEQKAAAPIAPAAETADVAARLDKLEKKAALATAPAAQISDLATRLDSLEKRAAIAAAPAAQLPEGARLDKAEKKAPAPAASSAAPLLSVAPKPSAAAARTQPSALSEPAKPGAQGSMLRGYSIVDVQDGVAVINNRYGWQRVAPGALIPGAGRVLRIERRGGDWFVVTSLGTIGGGPAPY